MVTDNLYRGRYRILKGGIQRKFSSKGGGIVLGAICIFSKRGVLPSTSEFITHKGSGYGFFLLDPFLRKGAAHEGMAFYM